MGYVVSLFSPQERLKWLKDWIDPECCDGTDEWGTGACANTCIEVGKEYREKLDAEFKTRRTVSDLPANLRN